MVWISEIDHFTCNSNFYRNEKWVILCLKIMSIVLHNRRHFVCIKTRGKVHFYFFHIRIYSNYSKHFWKKYQKLDTIWWKIMTFVGKNLQKFNLFLKQQGMLLNCRQNCSSHYSVGTNLIKGIFYDLYVTFWSHSKIQKNMLFRQRLAIKTFSNSISVILYEDIFLHNY